MAQDRPPAPQFPRDEVDPKTDDRLARNQQPFVEYFARAPPESGTKGTWPKPEAFEAAPKPPAPPSSKREASVLFVGLACVDVVMSVDKYPTEDTCCRASGMRRCRGGNASNSAVVRERATRLRRRGDVARDVSSTRLHGRGLYYW